METLREILFLPRGASTLADEVDLLHAFVISVTMLGSTVVFVAALWFVWRYHRSQRPEVTARVRAPLGYEVAVIGGLLSLFLLWWVLGYAQYRAMQTPPGGAIEIRVIAKQWMWQFADPSGRRSQSVIVVPRGQPVRLLMTSRDVIHSFFVPAFRLKQDVVPGTYSSLWFEATREGTYDLYCAEFCGMSHSRMRGAVVVLAPRDYARWLGGEVPRAVSEAVGRIPPAPAEDLVTEGRRIAAERGCLACHTLDGQRHIGPTWRGLYGSTVALVSGETVTADPAYLTRSMMHPEAQVVSGFEPVMPSYAGILGHGEAAALVELIQSLRAPATEPPDVILPRTVPLEEGQGAAGEGAAGEGAEGSSP